jgi:hypothetical protein
MGPPQEFGVSALQAGVPAPTRREPNFLLFTLSTEGDIRDSETVISSRLAMLVWGGALLQQREKKRRGVFTPFKSSARYSRLPEEIS